MTSLAVASCALAVAIATMLISLWTVLRAQQWRNTDDGRVVNSKLSDLGSKITVIETTMKQVPTTADIAKLTAVSESNHELLLITRNTVARLEGFSLRYA